MSNINIKNILASSHSVEKPFKCDQCNYTNTKRHHLDAHKRIHTGEKPFKCDYCSYASATNGSLTVHKRKHTGETPFKCDHCNYACKQSNLLTSHKLTHTGENPFKCDQCNYACKRKGDLTAHTLTHTGEKPFKCDQCNYACKQKSGLTAHIRTHTGKKPFRCHQCNHSCISNNHLILHKRTHTGEKNYHCAVCERKFSRSESLKFHKQSVHGIQATECPFCKQMANTNHVISDVKGMKWHVCSKCYYCYGPKRNSPEAQLVNYLQKNVAFPMAFMDKVLPGDTCTLERPDIIYMSPNERIIIVECDENQHRDYRCEERRISKISENLSGSPITVLRFNPHKYTPVSGELYVFPRDRYSILLREFNSIVNLEKDKDAFIEIVYLFYDRDNPQIVQNIPKRFVNH